MSYNVIVWDINRGKVDYFDILPYLIRCWRDEEKRKIKFWDGQGIDRMPSTFDEIKNFINKESKYQFWSRCEYEVLISSWPSSDKQEKIDVYDQIKNNLDIITKIFIEELNIQLT